MRRWAMTAVTGLALIACGPADPAADVGNLSAEEVEARMRTAAADGIQLRPGQYEINVELLETSIPGIDVNTAGDLPKTQVCLTKEQVEKPDERFFSGGDQDCTYQRFDMTGGALDMAMRCDIGGATMTLAATGRFSADGYEMTMVSSAPEAGMPSSKVRMKAKRIGACAG